MMGNFSFWHYLVVAAVLYFAVRPILGGFREGQRGGVPSRRANAANAGSKSAVGESAHNWPALGAFEFEVVGESNYQRAIAALAGDHGDVAASADHVAELVPEDSNAHDPQAVAVRINGSVVGYLSRQDARSFRRRLAQKGLSGQITRCGAMVVGGWKSREGERMFYGVQLDIKPFE